MSTMFALVDCNNFFVSCERVFRPDLNNRPTVVLSNNDGCIIARSNEIKALDIPMAAPLFKHKNELEAINAAVLSANFQLYGDISWRIAELLKGYSPRMEVYSIDEAFLDMSNIAIKDTGDWVEDVHGAIMKQVGVPVSVGLASTKTLAKLAADYAKKDPKYLAFGGMSLSDGSNRGATSRANMLTEEILKISPVKDVWGIGRRLGPKLNQYGVNSAWELAQLDDAWARRELTVRGLRTIKELRGESCYKLDENSFDDDQKTLSVTRTFGHAINDPSQLESAMAGFAARVAAKLRKKNQLTQEIQIFLTTGRHGPKYDYSTRKIRLPYPTADTGLLIKYALDAFEGLPQPGFAYRQGGLFALGLASDRAQQMPLFGNVTEEDVSAKKRRMKAMDSLNRRFGENTMVYAVQGLKRQKWRSARGNISPAYTSRWSDIPKII